MSGAPRPRRGASRGLPAARRRASARRRRAPLSPAWIPTGCVLVALAMRHREQRLQTVYVAGRLNNVSIFRVLRPGEAMTADPPHVDVRWLSPGGS